MPQCALLFLDKSQTSWTDVGLVALALAEALLITTAANAVSPIARAVARVAAIATFAAAAVIMA